MNSQKNNKKNLPYPIILVLLLIGYGSQVIAVEEVNINKDGVMLHGYDPVSYHQTNKPQLGWSAYNADFQGGTYCFVSEQNRDEFIVNSEKYAPAYGGYCSYGVRMGKKFAIDPHAWKIVDGILYIQLNQGTHLVWNKDLEKNISIADKIWPEIRSTPISKLIE